MDHHSFVILKCHSTVSIGMFNWGNLTGWTNAANLQLRSNSTGFAMDDEGSSWVGSVMAFGGIFGSIFGGKVFNFLFSIVYKISFY